MRSAAAGRLLVVSLAFLVIRVALLLARDPFFDELFTVWMARHPFGQILPNLVLDSGPPLYYFVARFDSVTALRVLSLVFATIQFGLVYRRSWVAGALLAVFPPAALFAVDARAYALCALLVTIGVLKLEQPFVAAPAFVLAAYTHYYGVLFFPLLLVPFWILDFGFWIPPAPISAVNPKSKIQNLKSFALALLLFAPGFARAMQQPRESMAWASREIPVNLSFAGLYPEALFRPSPVWLVVIALLLLLLFRLNRFAAAVFVPLAGAIVLGVYFPMRFESVIAAPLVLWLAGQEGRRWAQAALIAMGAFTLYRGAADHLRRPLDPYREAALQLRKHVRPEDQVVASGYLYLETAIALDSVGAAIPGGAAPPRMAVPTLAAYPAEQATHPGWRAAPRREPLPKREFVWIGERQAPELGFIREVRTVTPLFANERAMIARVAAAP